MPFKGFLTRIFNKLFLLYFLSYLVSMLVLGLVISTYLEQTFVDREVEYMNVAAGEAIDYVGGNVELANDIIFSIYVECYVNRAFIDFMSKDYSEGLDTLYRKTFNTYVGNLLSNRNDLRAISYYRGTDRDTFSSGSPANDAATLVDAMLSSGKRYALLPMPGDRAGQGYCYIKEFNHVHTWNRIGYMAMEFQNSGLYTLLSKYVRSYKCDFVITSGQSVIYFMSGLKGGSGLLPASVRSAATPKGSYELLDFDGKEYYVLGREDGELGIKALCVIPRSEIKSYVSPTQVTVFIATLVVGLLFVCILGFGNRVFSRRMHALIEQIGNIRKGDLSPKSTVADGRDELGIISSHFREMCRELQEHINKTYRYELRQKEAEYKLLQMQINPHFLFNTLEAIRMKSAIEGFSDASEMIYSLSLLLRQTTKPVNANTLRDEITFCRQYMDLLALKFKQGLLYELSIARDCEDCGIIRHIIQPLLENSIVHGLRHDGAGNKLSIDARRTGSDLLIRVRDNGAGMDEETCAKWNARLARPTEESPSERLGLRNVNDRIRFVYGTGYGLELRSSPAWGTEVIVRLKYLSYGEALELVQPAGR